MGDYGIADWIYDKVKKRPLVWFIAASCLCFVWLMLSKPSMWLLWLFASPILAWTSVGLLQIINLIESLLYFLLHLKMMIKKPLVKRLMLCICAITAIMAGVALWPLFVEDESLPEYFAVQHNTKQRYVTIHTNPACNKSQMTLIQAKELYKTAVDRQGIWTIRYNDNPSYPMRFCAKCISTEQMNAINDSIAASNEHVMSEDYDKLIEEMSALKEIHTREE